MNCPFEGWQDLFYLDLICGEAPQQAVDEAGQNAVEVMHEAGVNTVQYLHARGDDGIESLPQQPLPPWGGPCSEIGFEHARMLFPWLENRTEHAHHAVIQGLIRTVRLARQAGVSVFCHPALERGED